MTTSPSPLIITVNGGSSSVRVSLAADSPDASRTFSATLDRIGTSVATFTTHATSTSPAQTEPVQGDHFETALAFLVDVLNRHIASTPISGIGHRIVHGGGTLLTHQLITPTVLASLKASQPLDLPHLPREIALIESFASAFPLVPQVACFDTAFHRDMPRVAQLLPIPRRYFRSGLRRFGFHGISFTSLMRQLAVIAGPEAADGRVILAHLGAGSSLAAVRGGTPVDTTMSFTPLSGLVMATRPGDLDPGLLVYLLTTSLFSDLHLSPRDVAARLDHILSSECGLLGVSELSGDMRDLLAARDATTQAAEAVELFCYQTRKHMCALAGAMGGVDTIVFSGGIGEHSSEVRAAICGDMAFLGVTLDPAMPGTGTGLISAPTSRVAVHVIPSDEEGTLAAIVRSVVHASATNCDGVGTHSLAHMRTDHA